MSDTRSHLFETFSGSPLPSMLSDELLPLPTEERAAKLPKKRGMRL